MKNELAPQIKKVLHEYGMRGSLSVKNHSTLVLTIKSGVLDILANYNELGHQRTLHEDRKFIPVISNLSINQYHFKSHFTGKALEFLNKLFTAMNAKNWDRSDIQTDYFDVGYYVDVRIGTWDKPYIVS